MEGIRVESRDELALRTGEDVVRLRQGVRERAIAVGLSLVDQTKIVTAASELGRNTIQYGGGGTVRIETVANGSRRGLRLEFIDQGPGIADINLAGVRTALNVEKGMALLQNSTVA